jgi:hypothetical protein
LAGGSKIDKLLSHDQRKKYLNNFDNQEGPIAYIYCGNRNFWSYALSLVLVIFNLFG